MNLFLFAHQDDEYGVYPTIENLVSDNKPVCIVYLTSGSLDGSPSPKRDRESLEVLNALGIGRNQVFFLGSEMGLPDGRLHEHASSGLKAIIHLCELNKIRPERIYTPAWEGGHQDHDATYLIACVLAQWFSCVESSRQFPLYQGKGLPGILWHTFTPLPANGQPEYQPIPWHRRFRYMRLCLRYRSQWRTWLGLYPMYALNLLTRGYQVLQPLTTSRLTDPPHEGLHLYERRGFCTREQFEYHTRRLIDKITT